MPERQETFCLYSAGSTALPQDHPTMVSVVGLAVVSGHDFDDVVQRPHVESDGHPRRRAERSSSRQPGPRWIYSKSSSSFNVDSLCDVEAVQFWHQTSDNDHKRNTSSKHQYRLKMLFVSLVSLSSLLTVQYLRNGPVRTSHFAYL